MMLYMALAPEAKLTYALGGPAAEARFEAGVAGFEARSFRGCGIMTSEPFEVSDGAPREDGEFVRGGRTRPHSRPAVCVSQTRTPCRC